MLHPVFGNADARIGDADVQTGGTVRFPSRRNADRDLAFHSEFHGIADQVEQHLSHAGLIAHQALGHLGLQPVSQFEPFGVGSWRHKFDRGFHHGCQVERRVFQFQLARFDLGEIQDVVDDGEQLPSGPAHAACERFAAPA